nr:hypothetical protein [Tanacetum cinerariifolium]
SEDARIQEEEQADELYRDVNINQGRGLQVNQNVEDSHVTLTLVNPDGPQESSSVSSFVTSMLNPTNDVGVESIFTTASSPIVSLQTPTPIMTPSTIATITTSGDAPIPPTTIPSIILENLPTFNSAFRFDERLWSLETSFSEYRQTNPFVDAVSAIPEGPSAGSDQGSKRQKEGGEHASASTPSKTATESAGKTTKGSQSRQLSAKGQQYPHNLLQPLPLIPDNRGRRVIPFDHFINNDLEYLRGGASSRRYTTSVTKTKATDYGHIKWIEDLVPYVYSKRRIIVVTELKIVEWHDHKHLDWISVRRDDDQIYKFKEGDFKRLRLQDIEDMLLLLVQGKLSNLTVEERFAFNVSLRMFTRSIVIQRRVEDLQLGVESYQKRLNLTKPDTYRPDLKRREAYTAHSNPRGFIYQNKDKKNRLMRIDELHKFSDGTLNDVRNALDDRLKGIRMQYFPTTIWRRGDKDKAGAMIQAIKKMLKTRRIMRSLEKFVGGRLYEGDFRMLQRTI